MDTIAAIATPPGTGAIGIVRVSGPGACETALPLLRGLPPRSRLESHRMYPCRVCDPADGTVVDRILALYMQAPHSYTGEDSIELHCHGGQTVVQTLLDLLVNQGARTAQPGEFTRRAFLNGKIDLAQAEAVIDMIEARSSASLKLAARQLGGRLSAELDRIATALVTIRAQLEAAIDFPDEETDIIEPHSLGGEVRAIAVQVRTLAATYRAGTLLRNGLQVVLAGTPNSGKSTLLNTLLGDDRAIVTDQPGTTRDTVREALVISGLPVQLSDTAGIRRCSDHIEQLGIDRARSVIGQADIVLMLIDGSRPLSDDDRRLLAALGDATVILVMSKQDLPQQADMDAVRALLPDAPLVAVSALQSSGIAQLRTTLESCATQLIGVTGSEVLLTNSRHREALDQTAAALEQTATTIEQNRHPELVAVELREALAHLGAITGETTTEDILDAIFSRFCIGK